MRKQDNGRPDDLDRLVTKWMQDPEYRRIAEEEDRSSTYGWLCMMRGMLPD